ncbi:hypothetical protein KJ765_03010 [Candidatus Micrarchaeota archaeon]|nr:hypothetical protein [Candidatus Micrarchaeota archaeon]
MKVATWLVLVLAVVGLSAQVEASQVTIYKNAGCGHCGPYLVDLKDALTEIGLTDIVEKEFINDAAVRKELALLQESFSVPLTLQGHMVTVVDNQYLFEGHVPADKVKVFLKNPVPEKMVVFRDSMSGEPEPFIVMTENGEIKNCEAVQEIIDCARQSVTLAGTPQTADYAGWALVLLIVTVPLGLILKFR